MNEFISNFSQTVGAGSAEAVRDYVLQQVRGKILGIGQKLPSEVELSRAWGIPRSTIQLALSRLAREGFLERVKGRGTVVLAHAKKLESLTVYDWRGGQGSAEGNILVCGIHEALEAEGIAFSCLTDARPADQTVDPFPPLMEMIHRRQTQGILVVMSAAASRPWLQTLPVPVVFLSVGDRNDVVSGDTGQMFDLALEELARQKCRSVGWISTYAMSTDDPAYRGVEIYRRFATTAARLGLRIKDGWIQQPTFDGRLPPGLIEGLSFETYGYERFKRLWSIEDRPDGIIVSDDHSARGVTHAVLELGISVPSSLKLIYHRNRELPYHCPFPVAFMETTLTDLSRAMVTHVKRQFYDGVCNNIQIQANIVSRERQEA